MRSLSLLAAVCFALNAAAAPMQMSKVIPVPGLGDFTLGAIGPTVVPNANVPSPQLPAGGVPHTRRSNHDPVDLRPRAIHSADFEASPNSTIATVPEPAAAPSKRETGFVPHVPLPGTYKRDSGSTRAPSPDVYRRAERKKEYHAHMRNEQKGKDSKFDMSQFGARDLSPPEPAYEHHSQVDRREPKTHRGISGHHSEARAEMTRRADTNHGHKQHHAKPASHGSAAVEQLARRAVDRAAKAKAAHRKTGGAPAPNAPDVRPQDRVEQDNAAAANPASGLATGVKSVGALPHALSGATSSAPLAVPNTPVTSADNSAAEAAAAQAAADAAAAPHPVEEEVPASAAADAYPHSDSYKVTQAAPPAAVPGTDADANLQSAPNVKRHSLVMDTDPLVPPQDMTGKDPSMGVLNLDSNRPAEDVPAKTAAPKVPAAADGVADAPEADAAAVPTDAAAAEDDIPSYPAYAAPV